MKKILICTLLMASSCFAAPNNFRISYTSQDKEIGTLDLLAGCNGAVIKETQYVKALVDDADKPTIQIDKVTSGFNVSCTEKEIIVNVMDLVSIDTVATPQGNVQKPKLDKYTVKFAPKEVYQKTQVGAPSQRVKVYYQKLK